VADGGTFLLIAHDSSNLQDGYGGPQRADVLYRAQDVLGDIDASGLRIDRAERVQRQVQTPDGVHVALDTLVRGSRNE
jgi:hypothetical protein